LKIGPEGGWAWRNETASKRELPGLGLGLALDHLGDVKLAKIAMARTMAALSRMRTADGRTTRGVANRLGPNAEPTGDERDRDQNEEGIMRIEIRLA
jgi:hypothetical protein